MSTTLRIIRYMHPSNIHVRLLKVNEIWTLIFIILYSLNFEWTRVINYHSSQSTTFNHKAQILDKH